MQQPTSFIRIIDVFTYNLGPVFGLQVASDAPFALVVGCSVRDARRQVVDVPHNRLVRPGRTLWPLC